MDGKFEVGHGGKMERGSGCAKAQASATGVSQTAEGSGGFATADRLEIFRKTIGSGFHVDRGGEPAIIRA